MTAGGHGVCALMAALLAVCIKAGVAVAGHSIHWLLAVLIALVLVYGGFVVIDGDWID